jgi:hypothetical protein
MLWRSRRSSVGEELLCRGDLYTLFNVVNSPYHVCWWYSDKDLSSQCRKFFPLAGTDKQYWPVVVYLFFYSFIRNWLVYNAHTQVTTNNGQFPNGKVTSQFISTFTNLNRQSKILEGAFIRFEQCKYLLFVSGTVCTCKVQLGSAMGFWVYRI